MIKIIKTNLGSSVIDSVAYVNKRKSEQGSVLLVKFTNGKVYTYSGVPLYEITGLLDSSSYGRYFNEEIKGTYKSAAVSLDIEQLADMLAAKEN